MATTLGLGTTDYLKGLAFVGCNLYGAEQGNDLLHTLNPADGSSTGSVSVTMAGFTVIGFNGLTTHPVTNVLYAIVRTGSPTKRHLATIDPTTGVATFIGTLEENFAGLAFVYADIKLDQTICGFMATPETGIVNGTSGLDATASSGLPASFGSNTPAVCTVAGDTVSYLAVGTCTVTANQAGDAMYSAAPEVSLDVGVTNPIPVPMLTSWSLVVLFLMMLGLGGITIRLRNRV